MSTEWIDCPVPWCEGDARGHRPRNEHDFHMSEDIEGPLALRAAFIRDDDGPTRLGVDVDASWDRELTVDGVRELADQADAAAAWLRGLADQVATLNEGAAS